MWRKFKIEGNLKFEGNLGRNKSQFAEKSNKHMFFFCHDFAKMYIKMEEILNKGNFNIFEGVTQCYYVWPSVTICDPV